MTKQVTVETATYNEASDLAGRLSGNHSYRESYYYLLNIPENANQKTILDAGRRLSAALSAQRTDRTLNDQQDLILKTVKTAYEILSNPEKRAAYDAKRPEHESVPVAGYTHSSSAAAAPPAPQEETPPTSTAGWTAGGQSPRLSSAAAGAPKTPRTPRHHARKKIASHVATTAAQPVTAVIIKNKDFEELKKQSPFVCIYLESREKKGLENTVWEIFTNKYEKPGAGFFEKVRTQDRVLATLEEVKQRLMTRARENQNGASFKTHKAIVTLEGGATAAELSVTTFARI